jgi:hypothetical protein
MPRREGAKLQGIFIKPAKGSEKTKKKYDFSWFALHFSFAVIRRFAGKCSIQIRFETVKD